VAFRNGNISVKGKKELAMGPGLKDANGEIR
jgi:hypothetical protein